MINLREIYKKAHYFSRGSMSKELEAIRMQLDLSAMW